MDKKIVVNCDNRATRVALLEKGKLVELDIERPLQYRVVGNLYKGTVANVLPGMQAAFIDIGLGKNAFLYVDDVMVTTVLSPPHPPLFLNASAHYDEQKVTLNWNSGISPFSFTGY